MREQFPALTRLYGTSNFEAPHVQGDFARPGEVKAAPYTVRDGILHCWRRRS